MLLKGLYIPVTTPFIDDKISSEKLAFNFEKWQAVELAGFVLFGSTGEAPLVTPDERLSLLKSARNHLGGKRMLIVGTGYESTTETIDFTLAAADSGADAALVLTPNYYKQQMTDEFYVRHYERIAERSPIPLILYNVPAFTGVDLSAKVIRKLSVHEKIIGIKDSTANMSKLIELSQLSRKTFSLMIGNAANYLSGLFLGAAGAILAVANIAAKECSQVYRSFQEGDYEQARQSYFRILPLGAKMIAQFGVPAVKAAMDRLGWFGGLPRPPLLPVDAIVMTEIEQHLHSAQLI